MNNINIQGLKKKDEFLIRCFERFGSMNKNDYEVELMHLLLENDFAGKSDYFISTQLQIPVSKVKRLRYEADLKHPKGAEDYKQLFLQTLQTASFKEDGHLIQFAIHDKSLREYLSSQLEAAGSYYDTSFNSDIVKMTPADFLILITDMEGEHGLKMRVIESLVMNKQPMDKKDKISLTGILKKMAGIILNISFEKFVEFIITSYL